MPFSIDFSTVLLLLNFICIISVVFIERRRPQETVAWVVVMTFLPIVGMFFYLLIGSSGTLMWAVRRRVSRSSILFNDYTHILYRQLHLSRERRIEFNDPDMCRYNDMITMHLHQNGSLYSQDNDIEIFTDARKKYLSLFRDIRAAEKSINIQYFIIKNDPVGRALISLLAKKAREGVEVRLLYDEFGALATNKGTFSPLIRAGGHVHRFFGSLFVNLLRANHRNHRKIVVIDGRVAYTGGMNIGREYMGKNPKISPWRDTHVRITGSCVFMLQLRFLLDWVFSSPERPDFDDDAVFSRFFAAVDSPGHMGVQIVSSGPDAGGEFVKQGFLKMINSAKNRLYIQTPYLIPDEIMLEALRLAVASGVDVRIMIPGVPDKRFVYFMTLSYVEDLLKRGVRIYRYRGFLHSKTIVMDGDVASVGTTNFDMRSFSLNLEVNAFVYDKGFGQQFEEIFMKDMESCDEILWHDFKKRPLSHKVWESVWRLLAPLG